MRRSASRGSGSPLRSTPTRAKRSSTSCSSSPSAIAWSIRRSSPARPSRCVSIACEPCAGLEFFVMPGLVPGIHGFKHARALRRAWPGIGERSDPVLRTAMPGHDESRGAIHAMSPDLLFFLSFAVKMAVTAAFVVLATYLAERAGAVVGAMIATLPIAAGPAYILLSLEHGPDFIAESALSSLVVNAANCVFAFVYTLLAQRRGLVLSVVPALLAWVAFASLSRALPWTTVSAVAFNAVVLGACLAIGNRLRHVRMPLVTMRWFDVPLRA